MGVVPGVPRVLVDSLVLFGVFNVRRLPQCRIDDRHLLLDVHRAQIAPCKARDRSTSVPLRPMWDSQWTRAIVRAL
jgi:hypothetical protein